jgi:hypothetical protein
MAKQESKLHVDVSDLTTMGSVKVRFTLDALNLRAH